MGSIDMTKHQHVSHLSYDLLTHCGYDGSTEEALEMAKRLYELGYRKDPLTLDAYNTHVRDTILATIIGLQNRVGYDNPQYEILQELLIHIENEFGAICSNLTA